MKPPKYDHDCESCHYLGDFEFDGPLSDGTTEHFVADLYYCPSHIPTLIGRWSSEGPEYTSSMVTIVEREEARWRAQPSTTSAALIEALDRYRKLKT